jgi:thiol:disulfide interchange protein DsbC
MRIRAFFLALGVAAFAGLPVHADEATDRIKAELKKKVPEAPVDSVRKIPYGNLYEVIVGSEIIYTDDKASFLLLGSILDLKSKENVTEARMRQLTAIKFDDLPLDHAIKIVRGNGSRRFAIFEDPNCGYCKRFERDLMGLSDTTMYVFLYPILSQDSQDKAKAIWCAPDRGKTWIDVMVRDAAVPAEGKCATPIDQNLAFGREKRINGTPTIFFENGERVPGVMPLAEFEKKLMAAKSPAPTAAAR